MSSPTQTKYKIHYPMPKKFDILEGNYPDRDKISITSVNNDDLIPFDKKRFMLVLGTIKTHNRVIVAYLTSVKDKHRNQGIALNQYVIEDPIKADTGLWLDTLISFTKSDIASLKYTSRYFHTPFNNKLNKNTPIVGHLGQDDIDQIEEYLKHPIIAKMIQDLINKPTVPMIL